MKKNVIRGWKNFFRKRLFFITFCEYVLILKLQTARKICNDDASWKSTIWSSFFLFELKFWLKKKGLLILFSLKDFKTEYHKTIVLQVNRDNNDNKCMLLHET